MTDKELIKEEIERRIKETYSTEGAIALKSLLDYINSISEEPVSEDLEEEIKSWIPAHIIGGDEYLRAVSTQWSEIVARHFAEWQKQKDFEELLKSDMTQFKKCYEKGKADVMKEMKETLQTEYEKGRFDMREEMMKDAVEGTVKYEIGSAEIPQCDRRYQVLSDPTPIANAKLGDKVKIIIVKEK